MSSLQLQLGLVFVLVLLNAAFAGSEIALLSLRKAQLERLGRQGKAGRTLVTLAEDPNEFLATIQVGITLAGFLASATAATSFADEVAPRIGFLGGAAQPVAIIGVTMVLTFLTLVAGELAPKRIAMARAERWALLAAPPLRWLGAASRPVIWLLSRSTNLLVRAAGVDPRESRDDVSDDELRDMVLSRAGLRRAHHIFEGVFDIADRVVREILVPRRDVTIIPPDATVAEAVSLLRGSGHSRAPLAEDLDQVLGVVHLNDLAGERGDARSFARPAMFMPETIDVLEALRQLQRARQVFGIVVDEYGSGVGIVSLEDVLEEIVGEIYDEFDDDSSAVRVADDGSLTLPGAYRVHDLPDVGVEAPATTAATVAGVILERLGRLPAAGEAISVQGWRWTASAVGERHIREVRLTRIEPA